MKYFLVISHYHNWLSKDLKRAIEVVIGDFEPTLLSLYLYKILQEPLKFLKDPTWNFLAIKTIKEPNLELFVYMDSMYTHYYKISKKTYLPINYQIFNDNYKEIL